MSKTFLIPKQKGEMQVLLLRKVANNLLSIIHCIQFGRICCHGIALYEKTLFGC